MDFFAHQDAARRRTWLLVGYFAVAVLLMTSAVYFLVLFLLGFASEGDGPGRLFVPRLAAIVLASMAALIGLASGWKTLELRGGGEKVALLFGGQRINSNTRELAERRLLNVVEEMALAAGLPVPPVYVLPEEPGINAFAAGHSPTGAVIAVSRGSLQYLNRDELQGVVAHEFSHILRGDMRLNLRLIGILFGILVLSLCGYYLMRVVAQSGGRSRSNKKEGGLGAGLLAFGLGLWLIGSIGLFFGRLIKAAISRQREFLADASAVQFTRNPSGIAGALKKIGGLAAGSTVHSPEAENASHMFFASGVQSWMLGALDTHPPLVERIRRIEPQFDGQLPKVVREVTEADDALTTRAPLPPIIAQPSLQTLLPGSRHAIEPAMVLASVGSVSPAHLDHARTLLNNLPANLLAAVKEPFTARAAIACLLLSADVAIRDVQFAAIRQKLGQPTLDELIKLEPIVSEQHYSGRLPLIELSQPALKSLSAGQYAAFRETILALIKADNSLSLFEFVVQRTLLLQLDRHFKAAPPPAIRFWSWQAPIRDHAACVLSALCYVGQSADDEANAIFVAAWQCIDPSGSAVPTPLASCTLSAIGASLDRLAATAPSLKKQFIAAAVVAVSQDGAVSTAEAELLRAVADSLDCPLPPLHVGAVAMAAK